MPPGVAVADVGCGDGQLTLHLRSLGHLVIPTERLPGPALRARERLGDCRLGEGLSPISPGEVEVAVIAGMGGETIARILERAGDAVRHLDRLVLQPQQRVEALRRWLPAHAYRVLEERSAVDRRRTYTVLVVRPPE